MAWVQFFLIAKYFYNTELLTAQGADEKEKGGTSLLAWLVVFEFVSLFSEVGLDLSPYCIISPLAKSSTGWGFSTGKTTGHHWFTLLSHGHERLDSDVGLKRRYSVTCPLTIERYRVTARLDCN